MRKLFKINLFLFVAGLLLSTGTVSAGAKKKAEKDTKAWRYELVAEGVGAQGTYLIKVYSYSKKSHVALEQSKKNAVHGVIFKGFTGKPGVPSQRALGSPALEQEHKEFFGDFFANGGNYMKYVSVASSGMAQEVMKVGKEYKVGITVSVNVAALRKDLEAAGIIRGLGSGF